MSEVRHAAGRRGVRALALVATLSLLVACAGRQRQPSPAPATPIATPPGRPDAKQLPPTPGATAWPVLPPTIDQTPPLHGAEATLERLYAVMLPAADYVALAQEMGRAVVTQAVSVRHGERATFKTAAGPRQAMLAYEDELATYWVEDGLALNLVALAAAAGRLRNNAYRLLTFHFGQEQRPGIDGDPRFAVLHFLGPPDDAELGYYDSVDGYPAALFPWSNEREMVYLNMARLELGSDLYDGTLVHEVQHLIQANLDANEDKWLSEGLAQTAETLVRLDTVAPSAWLARPFTRLDTWSNAQADIHAHYAGGYLYVQYLREQLGDAALRELARHPANGLAAVRSVLAGFAPGRSLEAFTGDWATALYLDDRPAGARYGLEAVAGLGPPFFAQRVTSLPFEATAALEPFAVDYWRLEFSGPATISFAGDASAALIDAPGTPETFWYAPPGDRSLAQLTATVDLSGVAAATLDFDVWHDLEAGYDFAYLSASRDDGQTWQRLSPGRPVVGTYGAAWSGQGGWLRESVSLDEYAGGPLTLRFDVVTDWDTTGRGFAVSGLTVAGQQPAWQPNGFVLAGGALPQLWEVRLIRDGEPAQVLPLRLDEHNRGQATVTLGAEGGALVIVPVMPFAAGPADYWVRVSR